MQSTRKLQIGPLHHVTAHPSGERWTLTFTRAFPHRRAVVWSALTDPDELPQWAPYTADRNLGVTGPATLIMTDPERTELDGTVREAVEDQLLEHAWGDDLLRWELAESGDATVLTLHHTVQSRALLAMVAAGWHICFAVAEHLLNGTPIGAITGDAAREHGWQQLHDQYLVVLDGSDS